MNWLGPGKPAGVEAGHSSRSRWNRDRSGGHFFVVGSHRDKLSVDCEFAAVPAAKAGCDADAAGCRRVHPARRPRSSELAIPPYPYRPAECHVIRDTLPSSSRGIPEKCHLLSDTDDHVRLVVGLVIPPRPRRANRIQGTPLSPASGETGSSGRCREPGSCTPHTGAVAAKV